jgi:DNA-binding IclR family transcriptional regulator
VSASENRRKVTSEDSTLSRAFRILSFLADNGMHSSIRELSAGVGLPRSTVHRLCQMMAREGVLTLDERSRLYQWGPRMMWIARAAYQTIQVRNVALPILRSITEACDETSILIVYDATRHRVVFTDKIDCRQPVRYEPPMNVAIPAYAGASGKAILAFLPEAEIEKVIEMGLEPLTPRTITDPDRLRAELREIRRRGYAVSYSERIPEACGIGAPVFDVHGLVAELHVSIPEYRFTEEVKAKVVELLLEGAKQASWLMGLPEEAGYPPALTPEGTIELPGRGGSRARGRPAPGARRS